jgi:hypothetical protein
VNYKNPPSEDEMELEALFRVEKLATARWYLCISGQEKFRPGEREARIPQIDEFSAKIKAVQQRMAIKEFCQMEFQ